MKHRVWWPDIGEDEDTASEIEAGSGRLAAVEYAEESDSDGDYDIVKAGGDGVILHVRSENGALTQWRVWGEHTIDYRASMASPAKDGPGS